jgi:aminomethyltransferase
MEAGRPDGLKPCGLGARDTLRLEAAMPLYGHELSQTITPLEAGLERFVRLDKPGFIGRESLLRQREAGPSRRRTGIILTDRGIARQGAPVFADGRRIGEVTSGTQSPTLRQAVAMALVEPSFAAAGLDVEVEVRDRLLRARTVRLPFYQRKNPPPRRDGAESA